MATYLLLQRALRRERVFRDRSQPLDSLDDVDLISRLCTLRFMAKADFFSEVGDIHGISKSSVCVFLPRVCRALNAFLHIDFPTDAQTLLKMKEEFYAIALFPNVVGAIDGTLIPIRGMNGEDEPVYVCRKNFHALNVQGVVHQHKLPSTHDAYVFQHSSIPRILETLPGGGWLLGDSGYPLKDYLMTPFINSSTPAEERYNAAHCKPRNVVERAFGVLKARFRCLHSSGGYLPFQPEKCALVVETCIKLHNKAINERVPLRNGGAVANQHNNAVYQGAAPLRARELRQQLASRF
ncbi:putative nuclease HARBI1 [Magallana gigas]|uniref:putative nuclease HARBI1 n=1 Tax=Magallana gigas TaxID=29159 RepID=UPI00333EE84A